MDKNKRIKELSALPDNSLLVVAKSGLKRICCPFKVRCLRHIHIYVPGDILLVNRVKLSKDLKLVYSIDDMSFYHHCFEIIGVQTTL
jgi:hypothetical protein